MRFFGKRHRKPPVSKQFFHGGLVDQTTQTELLRPSLQKNVQKVVDVLGNSDDLVIREVRIGSSRRIKVGILYIDGLADTKSVQDFIMETLMVDIHQTDFEDMLSHSQNLLPFLKEFVLTVGEIEDVNDLDTVVASLVSGNVVLLLDGYVQGFVIGMSGWRDRGVQETSAESVIRGPREGFTETIRTNTALVRRKIRDRNLRLESRVIGRVTKTEVAIMYIDGIANQEVVQEVRARLDRIDIDGILESGYIEELIQDETYTPFPTIYNTERPDVIAAGLLEGRIAILVDGTPFVLLVPALMVQFFQAPEDYYQRADISTLLRLLRYLSFFIALLAPSLYIAITTFHQEMIPTPLLISLAAQREGVPFPAFIEALIMEITFEILREAGVRMPKAIAAAVSIVGTLVVGTAAVEAGIVSAAMVIVVAITAISTFVLPAFNIGIAVRILRFALMALAASFGLFGIIVGLIALVLHLCSLRSFGVPYLSPFAPLIPTDQKDAMLRVPWWAMFSRPRLISQRNVRREQNPSTPKPPPRR
ncbi:spore germination protein [Brevibacillus humidisoli]|nr:spore germination protein [Brevibacillus humidisoli]UFJ39837.1 spore germination protein [Brevibacillus humidisoli]